MLSPSAIAHTANPSSEIFLGPKSLAGPLKKASAALSATLPVCRFSITIADCVNVSLISLLHFQPHTMVTHMF